MSEKLLNCPFCGSDDIEPDFAFHSDGTIAAGCNSCDSTGPSAQTFSGSALAWNNQIRTKNVAAELVLADKLHGQGAASLGLELVTQDNAASAEPIFGVVENHRVYGVESDYADGILFKIPDDPDCDFFDTYEEALEIMHEAEHTGEPEEIGYRTVRVPISMHLTRRAARNYLRNQTHNYPDAYIYVYSAHDWPEIEAIRAFLMALVDERAGEVA